MRPFPPCNVPGVRRERVGRLLHFGGTMTEATEAQDVKAGVILADNPWSYKNWSSTAHGAQKAHYDGMETADIAAIPVAEKFAAKDCVLALWGTWPKVADAIQVMRAWGFEQVTGLPWVKIVPDKGRLAMLKKAQKAAKGNVPDGAMIVPIKPKTGTGFWFQGASEYLLIGVRGNPARNKLPILALLTGDPATFFAPIRGHSKKPPEIHEWVEQKMPDGPYLELFATEQREGWITLGKSLGHELGPWGVRPWDQKKGRSKIPLSKKQQAAVASGRPRGPIARSALVQNAMDREARASVALDGETIVSAEPSPPVEAPKAAEPSPPPAPVAVEPAAGPASKSTRRRKPVDEPMPLFGNLPTTDPAAF